MPERARRVETLRLGATLIVGSIAVLPIERVVRHAEVCNKATWCSVTIAPYALVLCSAGRVCAVDAGAASVSLEALRERLPELDVALSAM